MVEGYVLHGVPWRETSLIAEVFTRDEGRLGLVARGARRPRSAMRGLLQPFQKLGLRYSHKGELRTLMAAEWLGTQGRGMPAGASLMAGFYVNELLLRLLQRQDPHAELFQAYEMVLDHLCEPEPMTEVCLRWFECRLLRGLGIAPDFSVGRETPAVSRFQLAPGESIRHGTMAMTILRTVFRTAGWRPMLLLSEPLGSCLRINWARCPCFPEKLL
jgi:DNA repair protein RecO (recombination protein O)